MTNKNQYSFNFHLVSREESELLLSDAVRFMRPMDYQTHDTLKYFRTEVNRKLFTDFYRNQVLSNDFFRAISEVSSPDVNYVPAVTKPTNQV